MFVREEKGVTLIEMLISLAILSFLGLTFYQILASLSKNFETQDAIAEMQQQGRFAADLISRDISQAGYDPRGDFFNGGFTDDRPDNNCDNGDAAAAVEGVLEAGPSTFHYLADLDGDGILGIPGAPDPNEHIRYEWVGSDGRDVCNASYDPNTLYRDNGGGMQPVSSDIVALNFQYFDDSGIEIPNVIDAGGNPVAKTADERASIWRVVLTLTAQTDHPDVDYPDNGGYRTREFVYNIWLKNI